MGVPLGFQMSNKKWLGEGVKECRSDGVKSSHHDKNGTQDLTADGMAKGGQIIRH